MSIRATHINWTTRRDAPDWVRELREAMARAGTNPKEIARACGVCHTAVWEWCSRAVPPASAPTQAALLGHMRQLGLPLEGLIEAALAHGGSAARSMQKLIDSGVISAPDMEEKRKSIREMVMKKQVVFKSTQAYFGLTKNPFDEPGANIFMESPKLKKLRRYMIENLAASSGEMFALIGEVGCGKTTLTLRVLEDLKAEYGVRVVNMRSFDSRTITASDIETAILNSATDASKMHTGREMKAISTRRVLARQRSEGSYTLLVIDEAHNLRLNILHVLKGLAEMRDGYQRLISILLLGQPELHEHIRNWSVREFSMRLAVQEFPGMADSAAQAFMDFRLRAAGLSDEQLKAILPPDTRSAINSKLKLLRADGGDGAVTPLALQNMMAKIMNYVADEGRSRSITPAHVEHVHVDD